MTFMERTDRRYGSRREAVRQCEAQTPAIGTKLISTGMKLAGKSIARLVRHPAASGATASPSATRPSQRRLSAVSDFRGLCDPRSRGVCLYRLSFKERICHSETSSVDDEGLNGFYRRPGKHFINKGGNAVPAVNMKYKPSRLSVSTIISIV